MPYVIRQCTAVACRFRYPDAAGPDASPCPRCGAPTAVATAVPSRPAPATIPPEGGPPLHALLDNIRSLHNVGSIFRSAEGAGVTHLHLAGLTAAPDNPRLAKTALGAERRVPWTAYASSLDAAEALAAQGVALWAVEGGTDARPIFAAPRPLPTGGVALVIGHERAGLDPDLLARCQLTLALPMGGRKRSLNVAVAFGIAAYWLQYGR